MAIDFDTSRLPIGQAQWQAFLSSIEGSDPTDETEWLEHKEQLDPSTKPGGAALAKAIAAFANRDPDRSAQWLGGYGIVVVGLAPGSLRGVGPIDPAVLEDNVNRYLAQPRPHWGATAHKFRGKTVLLIQVSPPQPGDPIALIQKAGDEVDDGRIYVRRIGKSDTAKHDDVRRLEQRLTAKKSQGLAITVAPIDPQPIPHVTYPENWISHWSDSERRRLLRPLQLQRQVATGRLGVAGLTRNDSALFGGLRAAQEQMKFFSVSPFEQRHEEDRSEDDFREEVENYLTRGETALERFADDLRRHLTVPLKLEVQNLTTNNYASLVVEIHIAGDVCGVDDQEGEPRLHRYTPAPPRPWGPYKTSILGDGQAFHLPPTPTLVRPQPGVYRPTPRIENGGSVRGTFPGFDLRPNGKPPLEPIYLYADPGMAAATTSCTWKATATNVDAVAEGDFHLRVAATSYDAGTYLSEDG